MSKYTILVQGEYYSDDMDLIKVQASDYEMSIRKALYCYAIGDDLYEASDEEVLNGSEVVDKIPEGAKVHRLFVNGDGEVE